jgi:hypothetical protein
MKEIRMGAIRSIVIAVLLVGLTIAACGPGAVETPITRPGLSTSPLPTMSSAPSVAPSGSPGASSYP